MCKTIVAEEGGAIGVSSKPGVGSMFTLIIDLIERRNHQVIWRGYGTGDVDNPEREISDIPEVVEGILNKLPISSVAPVRPRNKIKWLT